MLLNYLCANTRDFTQMSPAEQAIGVIGLIILVVVITVVVINKRKKKNEYMDYLTSKYKYLETFKGEMLPEKSRFYVCDDGIIIEKQLHKWADIIFVDSGLNGFSQNLILTVAINGYDVQLFYPRAKKNEVKPVIEYIVQHSAKKETLEEHIEKTYKVKENEYVRFLNYFTCESYNEHESFLAYYKGGFGIFGYSKRGLVSEISREFKYSEISSMSIEKGEIVSEALRRGGLFGTCPSYVLTITLKCGTVMEIKEKIKPLAIDMATFIAMALSYGCKKPSIILDKDGLDHFEQCIEKGKETVKILKK